MQNQDDTTEQSSVGSIGIFDRETVRRSFWALTHWALLQFVGPLSVVILASMLFLHAYGDEPRVRHWVQRLRLSFLSRGRVAVVCVAIAVVADLFFKTKSPLWRHTSYLLILVISGIAFYQSFKRVLETASYGWRVVGGGATGLVVLFLLSFWIYTIPPPPQSRQIATRHTTTVVSIPPPSDAARTVAPEAITPEPPPPQSASATAPASEPEQSPSPSTEELLFAVGLMERDSESWLWRGQRYPQGGIRLGESSRLETTEVGSLQRFNPAVVSPAIALSNTILSITVPSKLDVQPSRAWVLDRRTNDTATYSTRLGRINPGSALNSFEAIYWKVADREPFEIAYVITAQELAPPRHGRIPVNAKDQ